MTDLDCDHNDLVIGEHMITCMDCGTIWRSTPVAFMIDPTTVIHPDDVSYVYEIDPSTAGNTQSSWTEG